MEILVVVVLYKCSLNGSATITSLAAALRSDPALLQSCPVLVWDNSPAPQELVDPPFPFDYRHAGSNLGVSGAYNRALEAAEATGCPWMLLLDQDTTVPADFLPKMLEHSRRQAHNNQIAAIVPFLFDGARPISPIRMRFYGNQPIQPPFSGSWRGPMFAANSATLMRTSALRAIGGYDENFWLDLSDVVVFHRLHAQGRQVFIAGELHVQHKVTNNDYDGSMSAQRYANFISAEGAYWDLHRGFLPNSIQTLRLAARTFRQYRRYRNKTFSRITRSHFFSRLFVPKSVRLERWRQQSLQRSLPAVAGGKIVG